MPQQSPLQFLALVVRVAVGAWFVFSGGEKVFGSGVVEFTRSIANYHLVKPPLDTWIAYSLPWLEIATGLCLMLGVWTKGALLCLAGMTVVFSIAVTHAWREGLNIACGCRGTSEPMNPTLKFLEFAGYFAAVWFVWRMERSVGNESVQEG